MLWRRHSHGDGHGHSHGLVDPTIATTEQGIRAVKWSFVGLMATALFQVVVVLLSGSVGLLADTIHNFGDASTAIPLWIALCSPAGSPANGSHLDTDGWKTWQGVWLC